MNTLIIGNSGSGKTTLAHRLALTCAAEVIHMDQLFWEPGGYHRKRPTEEVRADIAEIRLRDGWMVEGVFGELAELFLDGADRVIWLDLPWEECRTGLLQRGSESSRQLDPKVAEENFKKLLIWAEDYWTRAGSCSHRGHQRLFDQFAGMKFRLRSRHETAAVI